jgi:hypothetical protein
VTDFVNLKIKSAQSFKYVHRDRIYIHIFIEMSAYIYKYLYLYCILKKI